MSSPWTPAPAPRTTARPPDRRLTATARARTIRSSTGWCGPQVILVTFTSPDRVRDVIHTFNADGFDALHPEYKGGRHVRNPVSGEAKLTTNRTDERGSRGSRYGIGRCGSKYRRTDSDRSG